MMIVPYDGCRCNRVGRVWERMTFGAIAYRCSMIPAHAGVIAA